MAQLQDIAAVIHHLLRTLEVGIEGALLPDAVPPVVVAVVEERCVSIQLPRLPLELNHIILEVKRVGFAP